MESPQDPPQCSLCTRPAVEDDHNHEPLCALCHEFMIDHTPSGIAAND